MPLRFHWRLVQGPPQGGTVGARRTGPEAALPQLYDQGPFCREAERCGIDSLLVDLNVAKPEPMALSLALALATEQIRFIVATRPALMSPTLFVQQVNTFAALTGGRVSLNVVAGHSPDEQASYGDHLGHDDRFARMAEWLSICHTLWAGGGPVNFNGRFHRVEGARLNIPFVSPDRTRPEIYVGGNSAVAREVAIRQADCWVRFGHAPDTIREQAEPMREAGVEVGLRLSVLCRPTRESALRDVRALLESEEARSRKADEGTFVRRSDAVSMREAFDMAQDEWLTPRLWTGLVRVLGATSLCLLGTPEDVAEGLLEFRDAGVSQFILSSWAGVEELRRFGTEVLPLVRAAESVESRPTRDEAASTGGHADV
jgi:alkanesulfonate monooxygenase